MDLRRGDKEALGEEEVDREWRGKVERGKWNHCLLDLR